MVIAEDQTGWEETWETCYQLAVSQGKSELAAQFKKFLEMPPEEKFSREEFLETLKQAIALLNQSDPKFS